jgi:GDP-L-fucose synthase
MNILVTGGTGMLGSSLRFGLKPSHQELDLLDYRALSRYIEANQVSQIVHAAARVGGVKANDTLVYDFFMENLTMNTHILRACKEHNITRATFFLSTCVFPEHAPLPLQENSVHDGEPHPTNFGYAYAKRMLEVGSRALQKQHNINTNCIIPCNLYGENDNYDIENGHVIPALIHKCYLAKQHNTPLSIWGSGKPEREFIYSGDLARVLQELYVNGRNDVPPLMTVSSGIVHSIENVVSLIVTYMKFTGKVVFDTTQREGILRKNADNSLFQKHFPGFLFTSLEEGLAVTIDDFLRNYETLRK